MTDKSDARRCTRCSTPAPPPGDPELIDWEGLDVADGMVLCPDCIQPEELF